MSKGERLKAVLLLIALALMAFSAGYYAGVTVTVTRCLEVLK